MIHLIFYKLYFEFYINCGIYKNFKAGYECFIKFYSQKMIMTLILPFFIFRNFFGFRVFFY